MTPPSLSAKFPAALWALIASVLPPLLPLYLRRRVAKGKEIAERLAVSYETVHSHIRSIYDKLQVRSRTQAVAKYLR